MNTSPRRISAPDAAGLVKSGDWVEYGTTLCQPDVFDQALAQRKAELRDVKIRGCLSMRGGWTLRGRCADERCPGDDRR